MDPSSLIVAINDEIAKLTKVRELLAGSSNGVGPKIVRKRRTMSAEARARIAAAQRKRWAAQEKAVK